MLSTVNLVRALPAIWMWVGMALLLSGGYVLGYTHGIQRGYDRAQAVTNEVAAVGAAAQAAATAKATINASITKETENAYTRSRAAVQRLYAVPAVPAVGLRLPVTDSCGCRLSADAAPASGIDGDAENDLPDPATLAADCADTTLTLLYLQRFNESVE